LEKEMTATFKESIAESFAVGMKQRGRKKEEDESYFKRT
jgi:hypothetical protein